MVNMLMVKRNLFNCTLYLNLGNKILITYMINIIKIILICVGLDLEYSLFNNYFILYELRFI